MRSDHESDSEEEMEEISMNETSEQAQKKKRSDEQFDEAELEQLVNDEKR